MTEKFESGSRPNYVGPGTYVAIIFDSWNERMVAETFTIPDKPEFVEINSTVYWLKYVDLVRQVDRVYPIELFAPLERHSS